MGIKLTQRLIFLDDVFKRTSVPQVFRGIETAIHFLHFLENPRHSLVNITTVPVAILSLTMFAEELDVDLSRSGLLPVSAAGNNTVSCVLRA